MYLLLQTSVIGCMYVNMCHCEWSMCSLLQRSEEAVTFATGYLTIFLSHITNIQLMREFLCYLTLGQCDGKSILNYLIQNITTSNSKVMHCYWLNRLKVYFAQNNIMCTVCVCVCVCVCVL